jgi:hypothetical protein
MAAAITAKRRIYETGRRCEDCGWEKPTTLAKWWVNGFTMRLCKDCIKPYRKQLLRP